MHNVSVVADTVEICLLLAAAATVISAIVYRNYVHASRTSSLLLAIAAMVGAVAWLGAAESGKILSPLLPFSWSTLDEPPRLDVFLACAAFLGGCAFAVGLAAKVYRACILNQATEAERASGAVGVRTWLSPSNLAMSAGFVVGTYLGAAWPIWGTTALAAGLLMANPLMNSVQMAGVPEANLEKNLSEERRRVLAMVESGKISGEDAAELIGALGQSRELQNGSSPAALSRNRVLMLLGAAILLVGFCLPFEKVNVGETMRDSMGADVPTNSGISISPPGIAVTAPLVVPDLPVPRLKITATLRAGDFRYGLGWIFLALGMAAAILPLVWPQRPTNRQLQSGISLALLLAGTIILVYIASDAFTAGPAVHIQPGLIFMIAGYALMWLGLSREYLRRGLPALRPAMAT